MVAHPGSYRSCHELHLHESLVDHACGISLKVKKEAESLEDTYQNIISV